MIPPQVKESRSGSSVGGREAELRAEVKGGLSGQPQFCRSSDTPEKD